MTAAPHPLAELIATLPIAQPTVAVGAVPPTGRRPGYAPSPPDAQDQAALRATLLEYLPAPFRNLSLRGNELASYVVGGQRAVEACRRAFAEAAKRSKRASLGHVVLRGSSGSGKTAVASAWLADCIRANREGLAFCAAIDLDRQRTMSTGRELAWEEIATRTRLVVLDDLGAELKGASEQSGLAAQRRDATMRVVHARYNRGLRHIVTTAHDQDALVRLYDDGFARRIYGGAITVELGA